MNRKKILIVDDSPVILKAFSMKLHASGYDVLTAEDGSTSVVWIEAASPRRVVKSESNLATQMGPAKVIKTMQPAAAAAAERSM